LENSSNDKNRQRLHTCVFTCDEYQSIRLTVLDAGHRTQVFTSLWYPHDESLPVLGIDLLQFNKAQRHLCIVDFQPMMDDDKSFEDKLAPIRNKYPSLQGEMTDRFYNSQDSYFSKQMLLGRHNGGGSSDNGGSTTARSMVYEDLFPAYQQYLAAHVELVREQHSKSSTAAAKATGRHRAYDNYSAARDPAHALLAKAFGQDWADDYVYDILFPRAERPASNS